MDVKPEKKADSPDPLNRLENETGVRLSLSDIVPAPGKNTSQTRQETKAPAPETGQMSQAEAEYRARLEYERNLRNQQNGQITTRDNSYFESGDPNYYRNKWWTQRQGQTGDPASYRERWRNEHQGRSTVTGNTYRYEQGQEIRQNSNSTVDYNYQRQQYQADQLQQRQQSEVQQQQKVQQQQEVQRPYDGSYRRQTERQTMNPAWPQMATVIDSMIGHRISEFDRGIPDDLGCARFVSYAIQKTYDVKINSATVEDLHADLKRLGFEEIPANKLLPGDVILGFRGGNEPGHAAIYLGDRFIANNNSRQRKIVVDPVDKFEYGEYKTVIGMRKKSRGS